MTGSEEVSFMQAYRSGHKAPLEDLAQLKLAGMVAQGGRVRVSEERRRAGVGLQEQEVLYCDACQHHASHRYHSPDLHSHPYPHSQLPPRYQHRPTTPHDMSHGEHDQRRNAHEKERQRCRHCEPLNAERRQKLAAKSHDNHLQLLHRPRESYPHHRLESQSMDDHLHLAPRYQSPRPAYLVPPRGRDRRDVVQHDRRHLQDLDPEATYTRNSYHGVENPLFATDPDDFGPGVSPTSGQVPAGVCLEGRAEGGRDRGRPGGEHLGRRVINSTSVASPVAGGETGVYVLFQGS